MRKDMYDLEGRLANNDERRTDYFARQTPIFYFETAFLATYAWLLADPVSMVNMEAFGLTNIESVLKQSRRINE